MPVPAKYKLVPEGTPGGQPYNVAQAYARAADALGGRRTFDPTSTSPSRATR